MRISDWSSDVCSSDLLRSSTGPASGDVLDHQLYRARVAGGGGRVRRSIQHAGGGLVGHGEDPADGAGRLVLAVRAPLVGRVAAAAERGTREYGKAEGRARGGLAVEMWGR